MNHFRVGSEPFKRAFLQPEQNRIGNVADAGLQREQVRRHAALLHFPAEEFEDVSGDELGSCVGRFEGAVAVGRIGEHDGDDLLRGNFKIRRADTLAGMHQWNRPAIGRRLEAVVDVVHALERGRLPRVDLEDYALGLIDPGLVVADRGTRNQATVFQHRGDFDQRDIELAEESILNELRDMAEMDVHVIHFAGVDALASFWIGLIRQPQMNAAGHGQRAIEFRAGGSSGKDADLKLLPAEVGVRDAVRQFDGNGLGITRSGEAAHADLVAGLDESGSFFGAHDFLRQTGIQNARSGWGNDSSHAPSPSTENDLIMLSLYGRHFHPSVS